MQVISTNEKRPSKSAFQKRNNTESPYLSEMKAIIA